MPVVEKPSGTRMTINDRPETIAHAKAQGWKFVDEKDEAPKPRRGRKQKAETDE